MSETCETCGAGGAAWHNQQDGFLCPDCRPDPPRVSLDPELREINARRVKDALEEAAALEGLARAQRAKAESLCKTWNLIPGFTDDHKVVVVCDEHHTSSP